MADDNYNISVTESGADETRKTIEGIASAADKSDAAVDRLNQSIKQTSAVGGGLKNSLTGIPNVGKTFDPVPVSRFGNAMTSLKGILGSVFIGMGEGINQGLAQARAMDTLAQTSERTAAGSMKLGKAFQDLGMQAFMLTMILGTLTGGLSGAAFIKFSKEVEGVNFELQKTVAISPNVAASFASIATSAARTGVPMQALAETFVSLSTNMAQNQGRLQQYAGGANMLQVNAKNASTMVSILAQSLALSASNATQSKDALSAYAEAVNDGVLSLQQYNTIAKNAPVLAAAIAQAYGMQTMEFSKMVAQGRISAQTLIQLTQSVGDAIRGIPMPQPTITQAWEMLKQSMIGWVGVSQQGASAANFLANVLQLMSQNVSSVASGFLYLTGVIAAMLAIQFVTAVVGMTVSLAKLTLTVIQAGIAFASMAAAQALAMPITTALAAAIAYLYYQFGGGRELVDAAIARLGEYVKQARDAYDSVMKLAESQDKNGEATRKVNDILKNFNGTLTETKAKAQGLSAELTAGSAAASAAASGYNTLSSSLQNVASSATSAMNALAGVNQTGRESYQMADNRNEYYYDRSSTPQSSGGDPRGAYFQYEYGPSPYRPTGGQMNASDFADYDAHGNIVGYSKKGGGWATQVSVEMNAKVDAWLRELNKTVGGAVGSWKTGTGYHTDTSMSDLTGALNDNTSAVKNLSGQLTPQAFDPTTMGRVFIPTTTGFQETGKSSNTTNPTSNSSSTVKQTIIIQTPDYDSFRRSKRQLATDTRRALARS